MWKCGNCAEEIADKYKHCWNCGKPKAGVEKEVSSVKIHLKDEPPPAENFQTESEPPPKEKIPPPPRNVPPIETFPFQDKYSLKEKSPSVIGKIIPLFLWFAAAIAIGGFAYYSFQKTKAFENRVAEAGATLASQTKQFAFSPKAPREKNGSVKAKVLPLNAKTNELDNLYYSLPDDLRPANADEAKTILWLDCNQREAGRYEEDNSVAYRDICNAYLVDRETSKIIQVQDFLGELPPLKKQWAGNYASGKVTPEAYISYIRANQPPNERTPLMFASDSPEHHYLFKSELLYASIVLFLLGAVGLGWLVYKIKSAVWKPE